MEPQWETALHAADDIEAARLLGLCADPCIRDARFDATALGGA
jgi:hypothetical protein